MTKRDYFFILLIGCFFAASLKAQTVWDEDGVPIRQGKHIEWYRSADSDSAGYLYITWSDCRTGTRDIYAQKYDTNGNALWTSEGVHVLKVEGRQEDPVIVADGFGGAIIAWVDVVADPRCNVYCQKLDSEGNNLWSAEGVALSENTSSHSPVNITPDGSGGAFVTWKDVRSAEDGDVYLTRVTSEGDIAPGWNQNGTPLCDEPGEQSGASIGPDELGGAIITWKDKRSGTNYDIYAQRVTGNGNIQWQGGGVLVCGVQGDQDQVKLWNDGDNGAILVWRDRRSGSYTDIYAQRINAAGQPLWTPYGEVICGASGSQEEPRVINDGLNGAIFTWKDHRNSPYDWDVYAQRVNSTGGKMWGIGDVAICTADNDQIEVRLTLADVGEAVLVWVDQRDEGSPLGDLYVQRVDENGQIRWTTDGVAICSASGSQLSPLLRSNGNGGTFAIWGDQRSGSIGVYAQQIDPSGTVDWNSDGLVVIDGISGNATHLKFASDPEGAVVGWEDGRRGTLGTYVYAQKVDTNGIIRWTKNGVGVDTAGNGSQTLPVVVDDGNGGSIFAWEDRRDGIIQIYAQRLNEEGIPQWTSAVRICPTSNDQIGPSITSDGSGGAFITWSDIRDGMGYDVYAQRVDSHGNILWKSSGVMITPQDFYEYYAYGIAETGDGGAVILWQGGSWDNQNVYAQKVDADGSVSSGWPEGGLPLCTSSGNQVEPKLINAAGGGTIFVWEDLRVGSKDIYAQRVNASGEIMWRVSGEDSLNGLPICIAENDQSSPFLVGDGSSGCYIAWHDFRNIQYGNDIYAQKLDAGGNVLWDADGLGVGTTEGDQFSPVLVSESIDGVLIIWEDNRSDVSKLDIYAQSMDESGTTQWDANGIPVSQYFHKQSSPQVVPDGEGGAIISWEDMRSSGKSETHDIYAQRVRGGSTGKRGDVDNDGSINLLDVLATLKHIVDILPLDEDAQWRADCSGDGDINVLDALGIANVMLGLGECAP